MFFVPNNARRSNRHKPSVPFRSAFLFDRHFFGALRQPKEGCCRTKAPLRTWLEPVLAVQVECIQASLLGG